MIRDILKETEADRIMEQALARTRAGVRMAAANLRARKERVIGAAADAVGKPIWPMKSRMTLLDCFTLLEGELVLWYDDDKGSTGCYRERWADELRVLNRTNYN